MFEKTFVNILWNEGGIHTEKWHLHILLIFTITNITIIHYYLSPIITIYRILLLLSQILIFYLKYDIRIEITLLKEFHTRQKAARNNTLNYDRVKKKKRGEETIAFRFWQFVKQNLRYPSISRDAISNKPTFKKILLNRLSTFPWEAYLISACCIFHYQILMN